MGKSTDATRAERKAKKRALEAAIPDLPGDDNVEVTAEVSSKPEKERKDKSKKRKRGGDDEETQVMEEEVKSKKSKKEKKHKDEVVPQVVEDVEKSTKKEKKSKKDKKASKSGDGVEEEAAPSVDVDTVMEDAPEAPKKSKKERKAERRAKEVAANGTAKKDEAIEPVLEVDGSEEEVKKEKKGKKPKEKIETAEEKKSKKNNRNRERKRKSAENGEAGEEKDKKPARFIIFVGNLPFSATTESITAHFASVHPQSVRHLTKKEDPTKSKGCAFVEFAGYDHMKTCLKLMHHSTFDDGKSAPRKINVELTAGGGGNTVERKSKIEAKNAKLNEERIRKIHEEEKAKLEKAAEGGKNDTAAIDESAIHPSRRGRVPVMT